MMSSPWGNKIFYPSHAGLLKAGQMFKEGSDFEMKDQILQINLYADSPENLLANHSPLIKINNKYVVVTPQTKRSNGAGYKRDIQSEHGGYWYAFGGKFDILDVTGEHKVGVYRKLKFYAGGQASKGTGCLTGWVMTEYFVPPETHSDLVICTLKNKDDSSSKYLGDVKQIIKFLKFQGKKPDIPVVPKRIGIRLTVPVKSSMTGLNTRSRSRISSELTIRPVAPANLETSVDKFASLAKGVEDLEDEDYYNSGELDWGHKKLLHPKNRSINASRVMSSSALKSSAMTTSAAGNASGGPSTMAPVGMVVTAGGENRNLVDRPRTWKVTEISEPSQCRFLRLPDNTSSPMVTRLVYTNAGVAVLALAANAVHKLWKWKTNDHNATGKVTSSVPPQLWEPTSGILMTNDVSDTNPEDAVACFALSKNDSYVMSASGGKISLFNMMNFKTMATFMAPPPAATYLVFHPQDNNIIAVGMDDSTIQIYHVLHKEVQFKLKGHHKRITGLAFSNALNVLVSSGADSQLCVWGTDEWEKQTNKELQIPGGRVPAPFSDTRVQFHQDQTHLLVVHETQIAIFVGRTLDCLKQWKALESSGPITHAAYSCDSQSIYITFKDASISVLTSSTLRLRCRIGSTAYLSPNPSSRVYPLVVAANPSEPNQFALGLSDGGVCVIEPLESEEKWGSSPGVENSAGASTSTMAVTKH